MSAGLVLPFLQIGTGQRVLDVPATEVLFGGGVRAGVDFGRVAPFVGGNVVAVGVSQIGEQNDGSGGWLSVAAGMRVDFAKRDALATPFVSLGGLVGSGEMAFNESLPFAADGYAVGLDPAIGGFVGAGVDAQVVPGLSLGVEVGAVHTRGRVYFLDEAGGNDDWEASGSATFAYADVHVVFALGAGGGS